MTDTLPITNPIDHPLVPQKPVIPTATEQLQADVTKDEQAIEQLQTRLTKAEQTIAQLTSQLGQLSSSFDKHVHEIGIPRMGVVNFASLVAPGAEQNTMVFVAPGNQLQSEVYTTGTFNVPNTAAS